VADAAKAIIYSITAGAKIINASWRTLLTPEDVTADAAKALSDAVNAANDAGVLLVCTAGNDGFNLDYSNIYPASYRLPNEIVAAASNPNDEIWHPPDNPYQILTGFGPNSVHLAAPGVAVLTTQAHGDCGLCTREADPDKWYTSATGTSLSAAFVSGVAALVKSRYPNEPAVITKQRILAGVEVRDSLSSYDGNQTVIRNGRLSAVGALTSQVNISLPTLREAAYNKKKLTVTGSGMQQGMMIVVGSSLYAGNPKSSDGTSFQARVPKSEFPANTPVRIKVRNPDGGESTAITFTR
jgi:subtilisin family serine protease